MLEGERADEDGAGEAQLILILEFQVSTGNRGSLVIRVLDAWGHWTLVWLGRAKRGLRLPEGFTRRIETEVMFEPVQIPWYTIAG